MKLDKKTKLFIVGASCVLVCLVVFGISVLTNLKDNGTSLNSNGTSNTAENNSPAPNSPLGQAKAENPDSVAWLRVPGTLIDNVVMQTTDNDYYLRRDEKKQESVWGCYFADYYATLASPDTLSQNTVIYGHTDNQDNPDGERFSQLFKFLDIEFMRENPKIFLTVGSEELIFEVFAVFYSDTDFYYIDPNPSDQDFDSFIKGVNARNEYIFDDMSVTKQDKLLTLSGCSYKFDTNNTGNHRIVLMAKLVSDISSDNTLSIRQNPSPLRPVQ